jgi:S-adenosylmethionine decarboxylase
MAESLGKHILVELYECDRDILNDHESIQDLMVNAAKAAKATVVTSNFHMFNPYGVSGAVIIAESHLTIHTWPEHGYAAVDVFTCGPEVNTQVAVDYLIKGLKATRAESRTHLRGQLKVNGKLKHKPDLAQA